MIKRTLPRYANKLSSQQIVYPRASSLPDWSMGSALSRHVKKPDNLSISSKNSEAVAINYRYLSADQVDILAESNLDWISCLPNSWPLEILNHSLFGVESFQNRRNQGILSVDVLVQLTQQADYYPVDAPNGKCWSYSCCLHLPQLGRVRFIICFRDSQRLGKYAVFVTNRLDWSPRKVISQCLQILIWPSYMDNRDLSPLN